MSAELPAGKRHCDSDTLSYAVPAGMHVSAKREACRSPVAGFMTSMSRA